MNKTDTHSVQQVQTLYDQELQILKDKNVGKDRKKEAVKKLKRYGNFLKDIDFKDLNGKKYPEHYLYHHDDKPMNKEELHKLIDSVDTPDRRDTNVELYGFDLSGVSVGKDRFVYEDKGWSKPKHEV